LTNVDGIRCGNRAVESVEAPLKTSQSGTDHRSKDFVTGRVYLEVGGWDVHTQWQADTRCSSGEYVGYQPTPVARWLIFFKHLKCKSFKVHEASDGDW
jgi:hypothetical protein